MEGFVIPLIILFLICDNGQYIVCHKVKDSNNAPQHAQNVQGEQNHLLKSTHKNTDYANFCGPNSRTNFGYVNKTCIKILHDGCFMCRNDQPAHGSDNQTICFAHRDQIPSILQSLSSYNDTITSLEIVVTYEWHHHYMYQFHKIDLTNIANLVNLKKFALTPIQGYENYYSQSDLQFNNNTFENLIDLRILQINIPILDCFSDETGPDCVGLQFMIAPLVSLEVLDLSLTKYLSAQTVTNVIEKLSKNISKLCLITFQTVGSSLYTNALDMKSLFSNRTFENLIYLDLSENDITVFKPGVYSTAPNLNVFSLSGNILLAGENLPLIIESLLHPKMIKLDMDYQGFISGSVPRGGRDISNIITAVGSDQTVVEKSEDSSLHKTIDLSAHKAVYSSNLFTRYIHCINMQTLHDGKCNASRLFSGSIEEQKRNMTSILACTFPVAFLGVSHELIPPLSKMYDGSCAAFLKLPVGESLQAVHFSHIHWELSGSLHAFLSGKICFRPNTVTEITLNDNAAWMPIVTSPELFLSLSQVTGLDKLEAFSFNKNTVMIDLSTFRDLSNLKHLSLAGNRITSNYGFKICSYLKHLKQLDLTNSVHDPSNFSTLLADCNYLTNLSLAQNSLNSTDFSQLNLTASTSLKQIDFSHNSMAYIDFTFIEGIQQRSINNSKLYIDFSENMFLCGCNEIHLIDGFKNVNFKSNIKFINYKGYKCVSPVGITSIADVILSKKRYYSQCLDQNLKKIYSALGGVLGFICVIICIVLVYRYRWKIRYKQYKLQQFFRRNRPADEIERKCYKYDAFVAYCAEDRFWVHDVLMKTLEDVYSFRLCIHFRDFVPGEHIPDEIVKNIHHASRKVILVITDRFFESGWCSFELKQALLRSRNEGNSNLIFLKVGEINNTGSEEAMMVLNTYNYIEWEDDQSGKDLFWARLVSALYGEDFMDKNCCCFPRSSYQRIP